MKRVAYICACCIIIVLAFASGYKFCHIREEKQYSRAISDLCIANLDLHLQILETMRSPDKDKALHMLEVCLLTETPGVADEVKILGWTDDMQGITKRISTYCRQYNIFETNTNLPSHIVAKQFLDSHVEAKN